MIWLELRTNSSTYDSGWNFSESVWAPTHKANGSKWPFWELVNRVVKGDIIFHLRYTDGSKQFVGYSIADTDGYVTDDLPLRGSHEWDFSGSFYKVDLTSFQPLYPPVELSDFFSDHNAELRDYFQHRGAAHLFYAIQKNRLQSLFGAYFSEFNDRLAGMLLHNYETGILRSDKVITGVKLREVEQRIGHQRFSDNVKANYYFKCCFPNCQVEGRGFLISGHIARWADNEPLRGDTGNGLCLCLMHDKAFEKGFFTLDRHYRVIVLSNDVDTRPWLAELLQHGQSIEIKPRAVDPLPQALEDHWRRIGYKFQTS